MAKEEKSRRRAGLLVVVELKSMPVDFSLCAGRNGRFTLYGEE